MKNALIALALVAVIGAGLAWNASRKNTLPPKPVVTQPIATTTTSTIVLNATEVAKHSNAASCYSIVSEKVYDLTSWISQHPGGERAILGICGKDGTAAFMAQHGDSNRVAQVLASFFIGNLVK